MEEYKKKLLSLDEKTVYLNDIKDGEKIYKYNDVLYKNSDNVFQGVCRFLLGESKETTIEYLNEIVDEYVVIKTDFNDAGLSRTTYINTDDRLNNEYNYIIQLFHNLKDRFLYILNHFEKTYGDDIDVIKRKLINSLNQQ